MGAEPANKTMVDLEGFFGSAPLAHFGVYEGLFGRIKYKPIEIHVMETENYRPVKVVDRIGRRAFIITTRLLENLLEKSGYIKRQIIDESPPVSNLKKYQKIDGKT